MKEKFSFHILGLYLDKIERAFGLDSKDLVKLHYQQAADAINRHEYDTAICSCQKVLESNPDDTEACYQLGVA